MGRLARATSLAAASGLLAGLATVTATAPATAGALVEDCAGQPIGASPTVVGSSPALTDDSGSVIAGGFTTVKVLANDTDADHDRLYVVGTGKSAHGGSTCVNSDGSVTYFAASGRSSYTDTVTYVVTDGQTLRRATLSIAVEGTAVVKPVVLKRLVVVKGKVRKRAYVSFTNPNTRPVTVQAGADEDEGPVLERTIAPGASTKFPTRLRLLTYLVSIPFGSGNAAYVNGGYVDTRTGRTVVVDRHPATGARRATDGTDDCSGLNIDALPTASNAAPVVQDDDANVLANGSTDVAVLANDQDPDGYKLYVIGTSRPAKGSTCVEPNGSIDYYAKASQTSYDDPFLYMVTDGTNVRTATLTMHVEGQKFVPAKLLKKLVVRKGKVRKRAYVSYTNPNPRPVVLLAGDRDEEEPDITRTIAPGATTTFPTKRPRLFYVVYVETADDYAEVNEGLVFTRTGATYTYVVEDYRTGAAGKVPATWRPAEHR